MADTSKTGLTIALAQMNPIMGDIAGNADKMRAARRKAAELGADLVATPEMTLTGYQPDDLVLKPQFQQAAREAAEQLVAETADGGPGIIIGTPWVIDGKLYNAAVVADRGAIVAVRLKYDLPNYGVFDDKRLFAAGPLPGPVAFRGTRIGLMICEDMWTPDVTECLEESGAEMLLVINGSPFEADKQDERLNLAVARVVESKLPLAYLNQVAGQDEIVFDGASFVLGRDARLKMQSPAWAEHLALTHWVRDANGLLEPQTGEIHPIGDGLEAIYQAMVLGLRDYVDKNRFPGVILGLSGGIDSALSAAVAADALGPDRVRAVMMPSPYTSADSLEDAAACADLLGIQYDTISIIPAMEAFDGMLKPLFNGRAPDITEENLQSRARGVTLMALSNKLGHMVLSTGNKSEMSVGYATLYGDMCGGYAVLKDIYKTTVFQLSTWRNQHVPAGAKGPNGRVMPERVITKPPSAELKPDQKDQDSLPPYDELDAILQCLIERDLPMDKILAEGHAEATVKRVWNMLDRAEYKRRQAPPGVKVTRRAFGRDRRYPIVNAFRP